MAEGMDTDRGGVSSHFCRTPLEQVSRQHGDSPAFMGSYSGGEQRFVNWRKGDIVEIRPLSTGWSQHKGSALRQDPCGGLGILVRLVLWEPRVGGRALRQGEGVPWGRGRDREAQAWPVAWVGVRKTQAEHAPGVSGKWGSPRVLVQIDKSGYKDVGSRK